jgi:hypothetical protein
MKKLILILSLFAATLWGSLAFTSDNHKHNDENEASHKEHNEESNHEPKGGHKDEHGHEDGHSDEHGHDEEEAGGSVGPDKGITEKAEAGFKLSPEAIKTMGIQTKNFSGGAFLVPAEAIVAIKTEKTVFRLRGGWFKRVKIEIASKNPQGVTLKTTSFRDGDQIVLVGTGFLRIAEIFAEEGASHSHAH